jgi:hypothetical protein
LWEWAAVGKTQLAVEYARRHRDEYPGGIYWVNAAAPLVAELARLAETLDLDERAASEAERPGRLLRAFEWYLHENPNALVIFDNLADPLALREPTAGVVLWELPCHLLFTTRRRETDAPFETISVDVLPEEAALRLLLASNARRAILDGGREDELQTARAICRALGICRWRSSSRAHTSANHRTAASRSAITSNRLRREGGLRTTDAAKVPPARLATQHDAAVTATLRNQWDALETTDARLTLQVAALLRNAARVPRAMLAHLTGLPNESKDGYVAPLEEALNELLAWSLVEELTEEAIRLHPLVREFAASRIEDREALAAACAKRLGKVLGEVGQVEKEVRARGIDAVLTDLRLGEELGGGWRAGAFPPAAAPARSGGALPAPLGSRAGASIFLAAGPQHQLRARAAGRARAGREGAPGAGATALARAISNQPGIGGVGADIGRPHRRRMGARADAGSALGAVRVARRCNQNMGARERL